MQVLRTWEDKSSSGRCAKTERYYGSVGCLWVGLVLTVFRKKYVMVFGSSGYGLLFRRWWQDMGWDKKEEALCAVHCACSSARMVARPVCIHIITYQLQRVAWLLFLNVTPIGLSSLHPRPKLMWVVTKVPCNLLYVRCHRFTPPPQPAPPCSLVLATSL